MKRDMVLHVFIYADAVKVITQCNAVLVTDNT